MPMQKNEYLSDVWKDGIFNNKVLFCTGGNGSICSAQVRAFVHLGGNACIVGRNVEKTEGMAKDIATARAGSKVIGLGAVDVRSMESVQKAVDTCVRELGSIDFLM
jgi:2,4-dienoyl-CoA reductase [(3E)-enoyl-CoA-producing], peroxisomal